MLWMSLLASGCAIDSYQYGQFSGEKSRPVEQVEVTRGGPRKGMDRMSDVVSWPARKLSRDKRDKRLVREETNTAVCEYLEQNDLADVHVEIRDYDPGRYWADLRENRHVSPLARYSLGTLGLVRYTILPQRVFGGNEYNAYTNTLYVNSDEPALILHEAAYAKSVRKRRLPGLYAATGSLPFVSFGRQVEGARDVVGYARDQDDWELEQEAYRRVYPRVGAEATAGAAAFVPGFWARAAFGVGGAMAGGAAGKAALARREQERAEDDMADVLGKSQEVRQASFEEPNDDVDPTPGE